MSQESTIRRLRPDDAGALLTLRREALELNPLAFAASVEDDRALSPDFVRANLADEHGQAIFGYFAGADLAGMVGIVRESKVKMRHKATIWGMYVAPRARSQKAGRGLLMAALEHARQWPGLDQVHLTVTDTSVHARRLYEAAGFRVWGREPRAVYWDGRYHDDHHLVLPLR